MKEPSWLTDFDQYTMPGELAEDLLSYMIRVAPLREEPESLPLLDEDLGWCTFEIRRPSLCPRGIRRSEKY